MHLTIPDIFRGIHYCHGCMGNSSVEDTDVNPTVLGDRFINEGFNGLFVCSVRDNRMKLRRRSGVRFQHVHSLRELSSIDVDDDHRCTFLEETSCGAKSDSLGATGDDCDFAVRVSELRSGNTLRVVLQCLVILSAAMTFVERSRGEELSGSWIIACPAVCGAGGRT